MSATSTWSASELLPLWPRPRSAKPGTSTSRVPPSVALVHASGCCADLIERAFERTRRHAFWVAAADDAPPPLPHLRVRVPGGDDGTPPERRACAAGPAAELPVFTTLRVEVRAARATPLQHGVDESYELELTRAGGVLRATTEWGALRGLESFAQLVQWGGSDYRLCGLPLTVKDSPEWQWRGLLLDTARHFLPLEGALLPMLDAMAALKLNVLHLHLTDAHAFPFVRRARAPPSSQTCPCGQRARDTHTRGRANS